MPLTAEVHMLNEQASVQGVIILKATTRNKMLLSSPMFLLRVMHVYYC